MPTQVDFLWITRRFRTITAFPITSECLNANVFTSTLPEIERRRTTCATRATGVFVERKHCSRRHRHHGVKRYGVLSRQRDHRNACIRRIVAAGGHSVGGIDPIYHCDVYRFSRIRHAFGSMAATNVIQHCTSHHLG